MFFLKKIENSGSSVPIYEHICFLAPFTFVQCHFALLYFQSLLSILTNINATLMISHSFVLKRKMLLSLLIPACMHNHVGSSKTHQMFFSTNICCFVNLSLV